MCLLIYIIFQFRLTDWTRVFGLVSLPICFKHDPNLLINIFWVVSSSDRSVITSDTLTFRPSSRTLWVKFHSTSSGSYVNINRKYLHLLPGKISPRVPTKWCRTTIKLLPTDDLVDLIRLMGIGINVQTDL